jgi:sterol desaturase/sphingolipid hydroxylase (fatty acid hydroxylase superfamily)/predicted lipoprotein
MSKMSDYFHSLATSLTEPLWALLRPEQRIFWLFLLSSAVLASIVLVVGQEARGPVALLRRLVPRQVWLHRSALLDYRLLFVKAFVRAAIFGPFVFSTIAVAAVVAVALRRAWGDAPALGVSDVEVGLLYTVVAFVVEDWSRYAVHRLMHRVPALWELHKVHHSAEVLTPLTLYRTHPIESLINGARGVVAMGLVTGVFIWLFGGQVRGWEVLGVDAIGFVWTLLGANLRHSHVWLSYGPWVERVFLSPAQHQVHHSADPRHHDRNFGTAFALWDWIGGSLYVTREREVLRFGLPEGEQNHGDSAWGAVVSPVVAAVRRIVPRSRRLVASRAGAVALLLLVVPGLGGCVSRRIDRAALLRSLGECTLSGYRSFEQAAAQLAMATATAATDPTALPAAQEAWRQAIALWQQAELTQYGPASPPPAAGAQNLRNAIYSWPEVDRCLIEQQLVSRIYQGAGFAATPVSARGLGALEYLLFYTGTDNACAPTANINVDGTWAALSPDELAARKASYALAAAADVEMNARALVTAWDPAQGRFLEQLATAGNSSTVYTTQSAAINAIGQALFYMELEVKDRKLGQPLGLRDCATQTCPEAFESTWAERGSSHLASNLVGFERLFFGCMADGSDLAFDDLLVSAGAGSIATRTRTDLDAAKAAVDALAGRSLVTVLATDQPAVQRVYDAIKVLTDTLKGEFVAALQISPPGRVQGDND